MHILHWQQQAVLHVSHQQDTHDSDEDALWIRSEKGGHIKYADHTYCKHEESLLLVAGEKMLSEIVQTCKCVIIVSYSTSTCCQNGMLTHEMLDKADQLIIPKLYHI